MFTKVDRLHKVSQTDTHVYFQGGVLSQWQKALFQAPLVEGGEVLKFSCCEQYMMAGKAELFGDAESLVAIMSTQNPRQHKAIGRQVKAFNLKAWNAAARSIVRRGNLAKFTQNSACLDFLLATGDKVLVEGAHYDPVWGVAIAWDDPRILDEKNWAGTNWLGEVLMDVRARLRAGETDLW